MTDWYCSNKNNSNNIINRLMEYIISYIIMYIIITSGFTYDLVAVAHISSDQKNYTGDLPRVDTHIHAFKFVFSFPVDYPRVPHRSIRLASVSVVFFPNRQIGGRRENKQSTYISYRPHKVTDTELDTLHTHIFS